MNEHLAPVFEIILPTIEKNNIDYWAYGGIGIAAYANKFIRKNSDVDIFVKEPDFEKIKRILEILCKQNNFELYSHPKNNERPKIDIKINNKKRFSVISAYIANNSVIFKYENKYGADQVYPVDILEKIEKNISGCRFYTIQNKYIKEMFIRHIKARPDKKKRDDIINDAKTVLNESELQILE